jgi:hypothetical protein
MDRASRPGILSAFEYGLVWRCVLAALQKPLLEVRLESICEKGCKLVWDDIAILEQGGQLPETRDLDSNGRAWLLRELKSVMAVYGERCRLDHVES